MKKATKHRSIKILTNIIISVLLILILTCALLTAKGYPADSVAAFAMNSTDTVTVKNEKTDLHIFECDEPTAGLVFYGGARVEYTAYAPLMKELANNKILCILVSSPLDFALANVNAPEGITAKFPQIKKWYIGGHSMGGTAAGMYIAKHPGEFDGIVLLASYVSDDIHDKINEAISVYGSNDGVFNRQRYSLFMKNLPDDINELEIIGGNHAGFAFYGDQDRDKKADITKEEQIKQTVEFCIKNMIN